VKLHNDMQCAPQKEGFSLLNNDVRPMLLEDAAFHKFSEMSNIGPWIEREGKLQWDYVISAGFKGARSVRNGNLGGAARRSQLVESCGYAFNDKGKLCIQGYMDLGDLGGTACRGQLVESGGYAFNDKGKLCIQGYMDLGDLRKAQLAESGGYAFNDKGKLCIQGYRDLGRKGAAVSTGSAVAAKICAAKALDEHHTHICISALCHRGASVSRQNGYAVFVHLCCDPQLSGLEGQQPRRKSGLKLHMCKKCHRTAKECKGGAGCRATCNTTNRKSCQHLH